MVSVFAAAILYLRWRERGTPYLASGADLRRLVFACLVGNAVGWFTLPVMTVIVNGAPWLTTAFWYIRNLASLLYGGVAAGVLFRRDRWALAGVPAVVAVAGTLGACAGFVWLIAAFGNTALIYLVIIAGVGTATLFSVAQTFGYLLALGITVTAMTITGHAPFGGGTAELIAANVHAVVFVVTLVAMATATDREARSRLLEDVRRERSIAHAQADRSAQQAALLGAVIRSMTDGVLVLDEQGRVAMRNQAAAQLVGLEMGAPPAAHPALAEAIDRALSGDHVDLVVPDASDPARRTLTVEVQHLPGDRDRATVVALHDITAERQQVDELRTFARVAAHDLRQPLSAIEMWTDLLREELVDISPDLGRDAIGHVLAATTRMDHFLTDLMAYVLARDTSMRTARVPLHDLAEEVVAHRLDGREPPGATVVVAADDDGVGDRTQLAQLLDNLVGNALKYVEPGTTPQVRISSELEPEWVLLAVDDAGVGVPAGQHAAIFGEFYRAPEHVAGYPGTGLGLAICRRIVERHGGRIAALPSTLGGLRVEVRLPVPDPD